MLLSDTGVLQLSCALAPNANCGRNEKPHSENEFIAKKQATPVATKNS